MKLHRLPLFLVAAVSLAGVALLAQDAGPMAARMTEAADKFTASLSAEQKKKAFFDFDAAERTGWYFTPQQTDRKPTRKGIPLAELSEEQKKLALELLRTGTSETGYTQATTIMSLENVLHEEEKKPMFDRNPSYYFVSIFGKPSNTGKWGWRVEGHHLSVNFTINRGEVASETPFFFGANPAEVKDGDRKGLRTLPEVEDLARSLIALLSDEQKKTARQEKPFPEIQESSVAAKLGEVVGLPGEKLDEKQATALWKLIKAYTDRMPANIGAMEYDSAKRAGLGKVHFAYSGEANTPGKPYTYRIQGPTFVVEFLNVQADGSGNPANHIHSVWRHLPSDFGK